MPLPFSAPRPPRTDFREFGNRLRRRPSRESDTNSKGCTRVTGPRPWRGSATPGTKALLPTLVGVCFAILAITAPPASAQESQVRALADRVERLQREVTDLQRSVYRGEAPPPGSVAPADSGTAQLLVRVQQLEEQLRQVTGQIEELSYRFTQLEQKVDRVSADTDLRLRDLEAGAAFGPGADTAPAAAASGGISPPESGAAVDPNAPAAAPAPASSASTSASPPAPGVLGTISESQLATSQAQGPDRSAAAAAAASDAAGTASSGAAAAPATAATQLAALPPGELPTGSPEEQYQYAWGLLRAQDYAHAEAALRAFVARHPQHTLAGNAQYWLGETYYVRKDYRQAAVAFAEGYQQYPNSAKAPDNLLKLGLALAQIGEKADACEAFAQLDRQFPTAQQSLKDRALRERQRLGCG
ncbi:MAG: tol-pal system protein YbgF [Rhodospirillales bacterium]|nr:tol-pal system protein YbgF [Rhodospirillales bacterium]